MANPETTADIIKFPKPKRAPREFPAGSMTLCHVAGRWRAPDVERLRAETDTKRIEVEQAGKERL
jgi:hypothetical protein